MWNKYYAASSGFYCMLISLNCTFWNHVNLGIAFFSSRICFSRWQLNSTQFGLDIATLVYFSQMWEKAQLTSHTWWIHRFRSERCCLLVAFQARLIQPLFWMLLTCWKNVPKADRQPIHYPKKTGHWVIKRISSDRCELSRSVHSVS